LGLAAARPLIPPPLRERLWPFLGGIARQNGMKAIEIGGVSDHVHLLLSLPSTLSIAKALQLIKGGSSKWVHETFPEHRLFGWQVKYGAFGVSVSLLDKTIQYIQTQEDHHRKMTSQSDPQKPLPFTPGTWYPALQIQINRMRSSVIHAQH